MSSPVSDFYVKAVIVNIDAAGDSYDFVFLLYAHCFGRKWVNVVTNSHVQMANFAMAFYY